jgi:hypothetical protein
LLPSAEPSGRSPHFGPKASSIRVESGTPHAASEKSVIDPVQVLPMGFEHAQGVHIGAAPL